MTLTNKKSFLFGTLIGISLLLTSVVGAQEGNFFRGEERLRVLEETTRLAAVQGRYEKEILAKPGVLGIGVGLDREKRELAFLVVVDVDAKMPELPKELEGTPVMIERHQKTIPLHGAPGCNQPCHANPLPLPVEMGNSAFTVNRCAACTMGFKACEPRNKRKVYVTNAHCSPDANGCTNAAPAGTNTSHPAPLDATPQCSVATIVGQTIQQVGPNCTAGVNNQLDAASVASTDGQTRMSIRDIGVPSAFPGTVVVGDRVQKSGRTTGYTQGTVASTNFTGGVGPYNCCGIAQFVNQIRVNAIGNGPFIQPGDSGSALLNMNDEIVGLLYAGTANGMAANANQIGTVLNALGITLDPIPCVECAAEAAAERTDDPPRTMKVLYDVRDRVLKKRPGGEEYVDLFYKHSDAVLGLMVKHPTLLARTASLLTKNLPALSKLVQAGEAQIDEEQIESARELLRSYAKVADSKLNAALDELDRDLADAKLLRGFGIEVR